MAEMKVSEISLVAVVYCSLQNISQLAAAGVRACCPISTANNINAAIKRKIEPVTVKCRYHKPSAPQGPLQITGVTDTSSTIAWLPPLDNGGIAIEDYCVEIKEVDKKAWRKIGSTKDLHIKLLDLKKGSSYDIRITARNHVGYGKPYQPDEPIVAGKRINFRNGISDETLYVLMGIFPTRPKVSASPSPPTEFTVSDITSKSVTLHWGPPESNGGSDITGYVIEKQLNTTNKWFKVATLEPTVMKYCVENLKEKSEYFFKIYAENCIGLSQPVETKLVSLLTHATVPSPPTAPLEVRNLSTNAVIVEWGVPETDGGAPLLGYNIAIRDEKKTMWMEVGRVEADVQKFNIKDLQENHRYQIRILAKNEVGVSEPLETEEPYTVQKPTEYYESDVEESVMESKPSLTQTSETTTSWLRDNNMDADISSYSNAALLKRSEYFFRIWYYARTLFK
ncbi:titin-like [Acyrthosiphon pisum]|uniref:Fibronectin type-III domain-containing protein n=1 Tax=Acyrthosiphon pisum TaxID=7029 RepID=A0A8R2JMQ4_ACYPI|nr:titin-like [Acyrthosiphon pisum]